MWETLKKSVAAGISIGLGATVFLACDNKVVGAVLFAVGLYAVCVMGQFLYTGKIGYIFENRNSPNCAVIWLGNLIGSFICALPLRFALPKLHEKAVTIVAAKLAEPWYAALILGFFCGIIIYIAVQCYKISEGIGKYLGILLGVPVFILSGFEHSVADMAYGIYGVNTLGEVWRFALFVLLVTVGNGVGSLVFRYFTEAVRKKEK